MYVQELIEHFFGYFINSSATANTGIVDKAIECVGVPFRL